MSQSFFNCILYLGQFIFVCSVTATNWKIYKTKSAKDFSIPGLFLTLSGMLCLLTYAIHQKNIGESPAMFYQCSVNVGYFLVQMALVIRYRSGHE